MTSTNEADPTETDRPALVPPVQRYRCCTCGGTGLTSTGQTCGDCSGLGLC